MADGQQDRQDVAKKISYLPPTRHLIVLNFWFLVFFNLQSFGEGLDFCFDGSKEGYRLDTKVIKYVHTKSAVDCIVQCLLQDKSCRSANFRKTTPCEAVNENCELLKTVDSEEPENLKENANFDYLILVRPHRERESSVSPSTTPQITDEIPTTAQQPSASCEELLKKNKSLTSGVYTLRNNVTQEEYQVYCHMEEVPGCGEGGWTLVMKVDGKKKKFETDTVLWTNKVAYEVENGLEGLTTDKETKLASYWNTPFTKMCLGMKFGGTRKWIVIDHQASSLFDVISGGSFTPTNVTQTKWKSLIEKATLEEYRNIQGFNIDIPGKQKSKKMRMRIGLLACKENKCSSCIGFGVSITGCGHALKTTACGSVHACYGEIQNNNDAFGYILVQ